MKWAWLFKSRTFFIEEDWHSIPRDNRCVVIK